MTVHYSYSIDNILKDITKKEEDEFSKFKIRIEENIKILKEEIFKIFEISFKNKNEIENLSKVMEKVNDLNLNFSKIVNEIEEYKKITNDRIEKLFKLIVLISDKLNISLPNSK
jgi:uncharacterized protein YpuA (DUF1002 family)